MLWVLEKVWHRAVSELQEFCCGTTPFCSSFDEALRAEDNPDLSLRPFQHFSHPLETAHPVRVGLFVHAVKIMPPELVSVFCAIAVLDVVNRPREGFPNNVRQLLNEKRWTLVVRVYGLYFK